LLAGAFVALGLAHPGLARASGPHIDLLTFDRDVDPASAHFIEDAIGTAENDGSTLLVVTLDTPGGDLNSLKDITTTELNATVPIAVYVAPEGARAASAGMFIALSAPIVAMAENTRIGAASPIDSSGANLESTLDQKIKNDLDAEITATQQSYHRKTTDPVAAVDNASSFDNTQALSDGMINLEADTLPILLQDLDGQTYNFANGTSFTLHTAGVPTTTLQATFFNQLETVFLDPNVLFLLFIVAGICIYLELSHPGAIVPGTIGAIALLLFLFGAQTLSPNWAGLAFMVLGIILLAVDVRVPTHGVLTFGALVSIALGSFIFFDSGVQPGTSSQLVSPLLILGLVVGVGIVALLVLRYAVRSQHMGLPTGREALIGQRATVTDPLGPEGRVRVQGELWAARLDPLAISSGIQVESGKEVRVVGIEGLKLIVEPVEY
jgi:membrane-bound serine protease (ClpP class)